MTLRLEGLLGLGVFKCKEYEQSIGLEYFNVIVCGSIEGEI